jgi:hypothetical protein
MGSLTQRQLFGTAGHHYAVISGTDSDTRRRSLAVGVRCLPICASKDHHDSATCKRGVDMPRWFSDRGRETRETPDPGEAKPPDDKRDSLYDRSWRAESSEKWYPSFEKSEVSHEAVERLAMAVRQLSTEVREFREIQERMEVRDLREDGERFGQQVQLLDQEGLRAPCLVGVDEDDTPVPLLLRPPRDAYFTNSQSDRTFLHEAVERSLEGNDHEIHAEAFSPQEANEFFAGRLSRFIRARMLGSRKHRKEVAHKPTTYSFCVNCNKAGLQVVASPLYLADPNRVFGDTLTTPVMGSLNPGIWIFGTMTVRGSTTVWERGNYSVPDIKQAFLAGAP